jgi:hypothetical protein
VQKVDDNHLPLILDEHHEMLARPGEAKVLGEVLVNDPPAILRQSFARCDGIADINQILRIGICLPWPKCFKGPSGDLVQRGLCRPCQAPWLSRSLK